MKPVGEQYKFLDLSGYGFSGKHAAIDLCREFNGYHVEDFRFEFCLLRIQGGILDLKTALFDDWSPIRSDAAIRRFKKVVTRVGTKNSRLKPGTWFEAGGFNYDEHFNHAFFALSERYIQELVRFSWKADWPFAIADWSALELFWRRVKLHLGFKSAYAVEMFLPDPDKFIAATRRYLRDLLSSNVTAGTRTIVMHNAFEPFNPYRSLDLFDSAKCIIVDRDPRDNYVAGLWYKPTALPVHEFVERYRLYRTAAKSKVRPSDRVLRVQYEDLILRYEETVAGILAFLGEDRSVQTRPRQHFNPAISAKNVGIWKNHPKPEEIEYIAQQLPEYCYQSPGVGVIQGPAIG